MKQNHVTFLETLANLVAVYVASVADRSVSNEEICNRVGPILRKFKVAVKNLLEEVDNAVMPAIDDSKLKDYNLIVSTGDVKVWRHKTDTSKPLVTTSPGALATYVVNNLPASTDLHREIIARGILTPCELK